MEMTGKLIKYEMRSSIKLMAVIWAALIAASLLFSLSIHVLGDMFFDDGEQKLNVLVGIVELVTGLMYAAVFAVLVCNNPGNCRHAILQGPAGGRRLPDAYTSG